MFLIRRHGCQWQCVRAAVELIFNLTHWLSAVVSKGLIFIQSRVRTEIRSDFGSAVPTPHHPAGHDSCTHHCGSAGRLRQEHHRVRRRGWIFWIARLPGQLPGRTSVVHVVHNWRRRANFASKIFSFETRPSIFHFETAVSELHFSWECKLSVYGWKFRHRSSLRLSGFHWCDRYASRS